MKKLNRKDIGRLLKINPEDFLIVNTNYRNEIEVVGRLLKTSAGLALIIYKDRIISWDEILMPQLNEKESEAVESEVITNGVIKYLFEYATGYNSKVNAYAITECEFTEILPEIKRGIYLLYTEKEAIL